MTTQPADEQNQEAAAAHIVVAPYYKDDTTGAVYVHKDLVEVQEAWAEEKHVSPVKVDERFGDVESWCHYVSRQTVGAAGPFLTWSAKGLTAVIDYPARRQWTASHPFTMTPETLAWSAVATGQAIEHKKFVEFLEDHAPDIFEPAPLELRGLLRNLKGASNATFEGTVNPDGTAAIKYSKSTSASSGAQSLELPPEITIAIPVLRGHVDEQGQVVRYKLVCKLRASVGSDASLALRLVMPQAERVLQEVYSERVTAAKALLGDGFTILRGAE